MFLHMVYKCGQIFLQFCHNPRVTDGRTDRILIPRPRLHSMQRSKNRVFLLVIQSDLLQFLLLLFHYFRDKQQHYQ